MGSDITEEGGVEPIREQRRWLVSPGLRWNGHLLSLGKAAGALQSQRRGLQRSAEHGGPHARTLGAVLRGSWKRYGQAEAARSQKNHILGKCLRQSSTRCPHTPAASPTPAGHCRRLGATPPTVSL